MWYYNGLKWLLLPQREVGITPTAKATPIFKTTSKEHGLSPRHSRSIQKTLAILLQDCCGHVFSSPFL